MQIHLIERDLRAGSLLVSGISFWLLPVVAEMPPALQGVSLIASITSSIAAAAHFYQLAEHEHHQAIWNKARKQDTIAHASAWSLAQEDAYTQQYFFPPETPASQLPSFPEAEAGLAAEAAEADEWKVTGSVKDKAWFRAIAQADYASNKQVLADLFGITGGRAYGPASLYVQELMERGDREKW